MGVPTSEVGYTSAMPMREDHEVHKDMWWHWTKKNYLYGLLCKATVVTLVTAVALNVRGSSCKVPVVFSNLN